MIKAVLFDLDGTLLDRDSTVRLLLRDQYATFAAHLGHIDREVFVSRVLVLDDHGHGKKKAAFLPIRLTQHRTTHGRSWRYADQ